MLNGLAKNTFQPPLGLACPGDAPAAAGLDSRDGRGHGLHRRRSLQARARVLVTTY